MIERFARACYRHRVRVTIGWILFVAAVLLLNARFGGEFRTEFGLPGTESQAALDFLKENGFSTRSGLSGQVVFEATDGIESPAVRESMERLFADMQASLSQTAVLSPYSPENSRQVAQGGKIAYAEVNFGEREANRYLADSRIVHGLVAEIDVPGLKVELGGDVFVGEPEFSSEMIGFLAAMVILLIAFGSVLAMGLPIMTAVFGIASGTALVGLTALVVDMPSFSNESMMMIAIGVGIDYSLFIVTRYREGLHAGLDPEEAVVQAMDTAGRAVLFAGTTVIIAVLGLFVIGLALLQALAVGISLGVLTTMIASLTLLPAVLGFAGTRIDSLGLPHRRRREGRAGDSFWYRWSRVIQRHPWPPLLVGAAILLALAAPVLELRLGFGDAGNRPESDSTRRAYDMLSAGFGPGFNGPLLLAIDVPDGAEDAAAMTRLTATLNQTSGVAFASPPVPNERGDAAIMQVIPTTEPQDEATDRLVTNLRREVIPAAITGTDLSVMVGGLTPGALDFADFTGDRLPWFFGAVLVLSFLLLMMVFRSLLIPLKAVIMNLLSIGAAYGVLVLVFQHGRGDEFIGIGKEGPIEAWLPMMLFAIIFGLSMDYEVFLLSRISEEYDRSGDNASAVANGLASTARVITAAAAIMVLVFAGFMLGSDRSLKMFGMGLAAAVLLDATIVRLVLVPATMELLGDRNWWLPGWLDRLLPKVQFAERSRAHKPAATQTPEDQDHG